MAKGDTVQFNAAKPIVTIKLARSIGVAGQSVLNTSFITRAEAAAARVRIEWITSSQEQGSAADWNVDLYATAANRVVLDASGLESSPFRSVSLFHELAVPLRETTAVPFRLRSPSALRLEYYDAGSQELLAIDANGNGDFSDAGDYHARSLSGVSAAIVPIPPASKTLTVEERLFAPGGSLLLPGFSTLVLEAEVFRQGAWVKEAEDTLK